MVMNQTYITCFVCQNARTIPVNEDQLIEWKMSGQFVQDFFPDLNVNDRELLISGVCGECFDRIIPDDDDETCNGTCLTAADIGLYGSQVAYAHPDCPEHGDK
jgi:hypothetical protein